MNLVQSWLAIRAAPRLVHRQTRTNAIQEILWILGNANVLCKRRAPRPGIEALSTDQTTLSASTYTGWPQNKSEICGGGGMFLVPHKLRAKVVEKWSCSMGQGCWTDFLGDCCLDGRWLDSVLCRLLGRSRGSGLCP